MRTALYLRVSTIHQKPDLQADGLRRYAASAGLEIVGEYLDVAVSGRKEGRPQLQTLMRAARHHEFASYAVNFMAPIHSKTRTKWSARRVSTS